jgi:guanylate kinase
MSQNKHIFLIVGESGSGKTTLVNELEKKHGLKQLVSYTTRPRRTPNEQGHIFVTDEEFNTLTDMVAFTEFNGFRYCATSEQVEECDTYVIDPAGVEYFKASYRGDKIPVMVYVYTHANLRAKRMLDRGDSKEGVKERLEHDAKVFFRTWGAADCVIVNGPKSTYDSIVKQFLFKTKKYRQNAQTA